MEPYFQNVQEAASFISSRIGCTPRIGLILGTGLGGTLDEMEEATSLPYHDIPHYPPSTVEGHKGRLICGKWMGKPVVVMQGRCHLYEGYSPQQVTFPIRVIRSLGAEILIVCSAAGGLDPQFKAGELMVISDHINLTGHNPLAGPNVDEWGPRFPDMTQPYSRRLQALAVTTAISQKLFIHRGVYAGVLGPSLETAAETRFLRAIGADAVGMSTIMEVIAAIHAGLEVLGISAITNVNLPDNYQPAHIEDIIAVAEKTGTKLMQLLAEVIRLL